MIVTVRASVGKSGPEAQLIPLSGGEVALRSSWGMRGALTLIALGLGLGLVGCAVPYEYTVIVKDPRAVTLHGVPTPATVADGAPVVAAGPTTDPPWSLVMFREPDGGLRLRCASCSRDAYLVAGDGVMHVVADATPEAVGLVRPSPSDVDHGALALLPYHYCGFPSKHGCRAAAWDGIRATPWSNVAEIRARNGPRETGSPLLLAAAGVTGLVGTVFLVGGLRSDRPAVEVLSTAGGAGLLALTAVIVKVFVDGNIERRIDPPEGAAGR